MKKILLLIFPVILLSTSCKKKDKDPEPTPSPSSTTGSNPSTGGSFNGWCRAYNEYQYLIGATTPGTNFMMSYARAFFSSNTLTTTSNATFTPVFGGMVIAGAADTLQYYSTTGDYEKNLSAAEYSVPVKWNVAGSGSIPQFTTNCSETFPSLTLSSFTVFPANVSKNAGVTFTLSGFNNADRVIVNLQDNSGNSVTTGEKTLSGGNVVVTFPAAQTAAFINTNLGAFYLYIYNDEIQTVNGKSIRFSNVTEYFINGFNINN